MFTAVLTVALVAVAAAPVQAADASFEACMISKINQARKAAGVGQLTVRAEMTSYARSHTAKMIAAGELFHSTEAALKSSTTGWRKLGENVGRGGSCDSLHNAFMASPGHKANLLDPVYTSVGVGGEHADPQYFVTVVFAEHKEATPTTTVPPTPTTTAPKPTTTTQPAPKPTAPKPEPKPQPKPKAAPKPTTTTTTTVPATTTTTDPKPEHGPDQELCWEMHPGGVGAAFCVEQLGRGVMVPLSMGGVFYPW